MLLVIVGAGASFDSAQGRFGLDSTALVPAIRDRNRPPLAKALFAENDEYTTLLDQYRSAAPIVLRVRMALAADGVLEQVLEEIRAETDAYPARRQQLLAVQFYLRSLLRNCSLNWMRDLGGVTNYAALAAVVESVRVPRGGSVTYVSFNYDNLLES